MLSNLVPIALNDQQISQMDTLHFPPSIINRNINFDNLSDDIRTWRQMKEHVQPNERELLSGSLIKVLDLQSIHYQIQMNVNLERRYQQNMFPIDQILQKRFR